jgi:hypothetical protein
MDVTPLCHIIKAPNQTLFSARYFSSQWMS